MDTAAKHLDYCQICGAVQMNWCTDYFFTNKRNYEYDAGQGNYQEDQRKSHRRRPHSSEDNDHTIILLGSFRLHYPFRCTIPKNRIRTRILKLGSGGYAKYKFRLDLISESIDAWMNRHISEIMFFGYTQLFIQLVIDIKTPLIKCENMSPIRSAL